MRCNHRSPFAPLLFLLASPFAPLLAAQEGGRAPSADPRARFLTSRESPVVLPLPLEDDAFLFAVFGDRTGGPAAGVQVLAQAVADVNVLDPDLVMTVGDLVEGYNETPQWLAQMREFKSIMGRLERPWFPVVGNHDLYWRGKGPAPEREHEADYEEHFGPLWYAFEHKGCWFICLHSDEDDPEKGDKTFNEPRGQKMSAEQFAWLDRTLQQAAGARHVFLFLHHPRWIGGNYGDDWQRVHRRLVEAGNVTAVFAGHIHHMRYDGARDGIEYFALATVGGSQEGIAPAAGWLHEYHLVMVRDGGIEVATLPVGTVIDPREVTGAISEEVRALAAALPRRVEGAARFAADRSWAELAVELKNPTTRPVEVTVAPRSADARWRFFPDHDHATLAPGEQRRVVLRTRHASALPDDDVRAPELSLQVDYLGEARRFPLPERTLPIAIDPASLPRAAPRGALEEQALALDGKSGRVRVESERLALPDGPFTVEGWFAARQHGPRVGLLCKTESSEFGLFVNDGTPEFLVHLAGAYVTVKSSAALPLGDWHHLAALFDGEQLRLYLDGALVGQAAGRGARTQNDLPLLIGADVKKDGGAESFFAGRVDAVRISTGARYAGERFAPARELPIDAATLLALDMESSCGPWLLDGSLRAQAAERVGGAEVGGAEADAR
ncbi:MAG: metallophosphoesterase [Planctomycetes bacterium]|nr:metallophosphoesterase [Planctomycetota bacterium]